MLYNVDITKRMRASVDQNFVLLSILYNFILHKLFSLNVKMDIIFVENIAQ